MRAEVLADGQGWLGTRVAQDVEVLADVAADTGIHATRLTKGAGEGGVELSGHDLWSDRVGAVKAREFVLDRRRLGRLDFLA